MNLFVSFNMTKVVVGVGSGNESGFKTLEGTRKRQIGINKMYDSVETEEVVGYMSTSASKTKS